MIPDMKLEILKICKMASGNFSLEMTEQVSWKNFPYFAEEFISLFSGSIVSKADTVDARVWDVIINDKKFWLAFQDFPVMISLDAQDETGNEEIIEIQEMLKTDEYTAPHT